VSRPRGNPVDKVRLQLPSHLGRAIAAHAYEANPAAYQTLDCRYAHFLFETRRNDLSLLEGDQEDSAHAFARFAAAIASLAFV
jgi:hypothetical protein